LPVQWALDLHLKKQLKGYFHLDASPEHVKPMPMPMPLVASADAGDDGVTAALVLDHCSTFFYLKSMFFILPTRKTLLSFPRC
jgi:hypothetical protein